MNSGVAVYTAKNNGKDFIFHGSQQGRRTDRENRKQGKDYWQKRGLGNVSCRKGFWSL